MRDREIIFENFFSLLGVQFLNYILQLAILPYLVRVLGIEGFGLYSFVFAVAQYFLVFVDYGFNLSATKSVSIARSNKEKLSEIFSNVLIIKVMLFLVSIIVLFFLITTVPKFSADPKAYIVSFIGVLGNLIFPIWYYQGLEKTKYIALFNIIGKTITTSLIFIFIKNPSDVILAIFIQSMSVVITAFIALIFIYIKWPLNLVFPSKQSLINTFRDGWDIFITIFSSNLLGNSYILILGILTDNKTVGYFSIADKIVRVFHSLVSPLSNAIFPHVSKLFYESREEALRLLRKVLYWGGIGFSGCFVILIIFANYFIRIFTGTNSNHIRNLISIIAVLPLSIFVDNIYGTQILINIGRTNEFMKAIIIPGLISIVASLIFVPIFKDYASITIYLISQLSILTLMVYFVRRNKIYLIKEGFV